MDLTSAVGSVGAEGVWWIAEDDPGNRVDRDCERTGVDGRDRIGGLDEGNSDEDPIEN